MPRRGFRVGVPFSGRWVEVANSDAVDFGGSGLGNLGAVEAAETPAHGRSHSLDITLPPLAAVFFKGVRPAGEPQAKTEAETVEGEATAPNETETADAAGVPATQTEPPPRKTARRTRRKLETAT